MLCQNGSLPKLFELLLDRKNVAVDDVWKEHRS